MDPTLGAAPPQTQAQADKDKFVYLLAALLIDGLPMIDIDATAAEARDTTRRLDVDPAVDE